MRGREEGRRKEGEGMREGGSGGDEYMWELL